MAENKKNIASVGGVGLDLTLNDSGLYAEVKQAADKVKAQFVREFANIGKETDNTFKKSFSGVTTSSKAAANHVKDQFSKSAKAAGSEVEKQLKASFNEVSSASNSMSESLVSGFKKVGAAVIAAFSVAKIKEFGQSAIEQAARMNAQQSALTQTFREYEGAAVKAMKEVANESGILDTRLQSVGTQIFAFAKTSGMDSASALNMMKEALQATADSAAYYDRSLEDTAESLKSFLKGNYANDAALGVSATETTRNAAAMKLYGQSFKDLSEAQKQLTLLQMVKDANALSGAMGQAAREADGWENVIGNLKESWNQLLAAVGKPILQGAIVVIKNLTGWISNLASYAKAASQALGELFGWGSDETAVTAVNTAQTASSIAESVENENQLTQAVAKTNAEVKRGIAGFDKLNLISKSALNGSDNSGKSDGIDNALNNAVPQSALTDTEGGIDRINNKINELKETIKKFIQPIIEFYNKHIKPIVDKITLFIGHIIQSTKKWLENTDWKPLQDALANLFDSIDEFLDENLPRLEWLWDNVILPIGTLLVEKILPTLVNLLSGILDFLSPIIAALIDDFKPLWENTLKPALEKISEIFTKIVDDIKPKLKEMGKEIGDALREWEPIIKELSEILGPLLDMLLTFLGGALGGALKAGIDSLAIIARGIGGVARAIKGLINQDWKEVSEGLDLVKDGLNEIAIAPFKHTWAAVSGAATNVYNEAQKYNSEDTSGASHSFATGGIVKAPTLAVVGDNPGAGSGNPEVISPLNKLQSMINVSGGEESDKLDRIINLLDRVCDMVYLNRTEATAMQRS